MLEWVWQTPRILSTIPEADRERRREAQDAERKCRFDGSGIVTHRFEHLKPQKPARDNSCTTLLEEFVQFGNIGLKLGRFVFP